MATLHEDIKTQAAWLVKAFAADNLTLDYSISSLVEVDRFFALHAKNGQPLKGRLTKNLGAVIFSIGAYVGETIINNVPGSYWETVDEDPEGEINAAVKFADGTTMWPLQKVMKRYKNGAEDSVYIYAYHITKDYIKEPFDGSVWDAMKEKNSGKAWWKFWGMWRRS